MCGSSLYIYVFINLYISPLRTELCTITIELIFGYMVLQARSVCAFWVGAFCEKRNFWKTRAGGFPPSKIVLIGTANISSNPRIGRNITHTKSTHATVLSDHICKAQLYGDQPPLSTALRRRRLQFAGHCKRSFQ